MKSNAREFLKCMFCNSNDPITAEHIFGRSLSRRFKDQPIAKVLSKATDKHLPRDNKAHHNAGMTPMSFTSKSMCKKCNEEFGKEQEKSMPILEKLFKGKTNKIQEEHLEKTLRYFQRIGILVDLETATYDPTLMTKEEEGKKLNQHTKRSPSYLTQEERQLFKNGDILPNITVYLGKHRGEHGRQYTMNVFRCPGRDFYEGERKGLLQTMFTFSFKRITCTIIVGSTDNNQNEKLQIFDEKGEEFCIAISQVSDDFDVEKNYHFITTTLDGSIDLKNN